MRTKVLIDATMLQKKNGMNYSLRNLIKGFSSSIKAKNFDFYIVTTEKGKPYIPNNFCKKLIITPLILPQPIVEQILLSLIAKIHSCSIILCPYNTFPLVNYGAKRLVIVYDVIYLHSLRQVPLSPSITQNIMRFYRSFIVKHFLRFVDQVATISNYSRNEIISRTNISPRLVTVIPLARGDILSNENKVVSESTTATLNLKAKPYFLHLAAVDPRKNTRLVINQFLKFAREHTQYRLVLVGKLPPSLVNTVEQENNIVYLGTVSDKELVELYKSAFCLLFPSRLEGFGLPVLEAFTTGCPVITTSLSAIPEVAQDAAIYIDLDSPNDLSKKMYELHSNPSLQNNLIIKGKLIAKKYSWKNTTLGYIQLLKKMAK